MTIKWQIIFASILLLQYFFVPAEGYGESDASGHPNYQERANHVFLNAVRISPSQYKTVYMAGYSPSPASILGTAYPARPPVYLEPRLVTGAYAHSNDMATNGCFSHNSCNGTATFTRIGYYYSCSGTMGENIAAGNADPLDTNNQWLCDKVGSACAADGSADDGHRKNIMSASYKVVGTGYGYSASSTYKHYWTQDFGGASCAPAPTSPVFGGSHRIKSGAIRFIAVYYTSPAVAPTSATVTIAGTSTPLALDIGAAGAGTYFVQQTSVAGCRPYFFTFGSVRYPETGCLVTYSDSCTQSFDATCGGTTSGSVATTAAATSAAATSSSVAAAAATSASATTTTKATSTSTSGSATSGGSAIHNVYTSSLQNGWTMYSGGTVSHSFAYSGNTGLRVVLTSSSNFFWFDHSPAVTNVYTTLRLTIASAANANVLIYFNGCYYVNKAITPTWQTINIPLSSISCSGTPVAAFGNPKQLVFQSASGAPTIYLTNVAFV